MHLVIQVPLGYPQERCYILDVLFSLLLGLEYRLVVSDRDEIRITIPSSPQQQRELLIVDQFFQMPSGYWLTTCALPKRPLEHWNMVPKEITHVLVKETIPVIFGKRLHDSSFCCIQDHSIKIGIDILGSAFFLLTRYEEIVLSSRDSHGRFAAVDSLALQEGFLERPIVDEYVEILWWAIKKLWPFLNRRNKHWTVLLSHDVDCPFKLADKSFRTVLRDSLSLTYHHQSLGIGIRHLASYISSRIGSLDFDPYFTFDEIMSLSEQHGFQSAFYFLCGKSDPVYDARYEIDCPWILRLITDISSRGHEVGIHPSYQTYRDANQTRNEFRRLKEICSKVGVSIKEWGGRQHYLRWENPTTWQNWDDAGIDYDSTLSFADHVGFRCGTCQEYPVYNLLSRRQLRLRERPLIFMEKTALCYMGLSLKDTATKIERLANQCKKYNGCFTVLWHNNSLVTQDQKHWYRVIVEMLGRMYIA